MSDIISDLYEKAVVATRNYHEDYPDSTQKQLNAYCAKVLGKLIIEEAHYVTVVRGVDDLDDVMKHFGVEE